MGYLITLIFVVLWGWYSGNTFDEHAGLYGFIGGVVIAMISIAISAYGEVI